MSAEGRGPKSLLNREVKVALNELLDFGPPESGQHPPSDTKPGDLDARIRRLVDQLRDLNARLDRLSHLF